MHIELIQKNKFVCDLRDHLMSIYSTGYHYTYGEEDYKGQKIGDVYCSIRKDINEPRDINGFCFRKDLCSLKPNDASDVLKNVYDFSQKDKNIESILEKGKNLVIKFGKKDYIVTSHIEEGYAGEIYIYFMELPSFNFHYIFLL